MFHSYRKKVKLGEKTMYSKLKTRLMWESVLGEWNEYIFEKVKSLMLSY